MDDDGGQEEYIRHVLEAYRKTPGTIGTVRRADRMLAAQLYQRGLSVKVIENALVLAAARRLMRPADGPPSGRFVRWLIFCRWSRKCGNYASARITSNISATSSHPPGPHGRTPRFGAARMMEK
jgi:hypothetical protein